MSLAFHTIHLRVNDSATGLATPVRVRCTAQGNYCPPLGRLVHFATEPGEDVGGNVLLAGLAYAYSSGSCEIQVPAGTVDFELRKGPEYLPLVSSAALGTGKMSVRLVLQRWCNPREEGWYSGDTRAHFLPPHTALLEAECEDLAVLNLLIAERRYTSSSGQPLLSVPNLAAFSGQQPLVHSPGHLVAVNTHNRHPHLGSLGLLHTHRVVFPLSFGAPDGTDDWSLTAWCEQGHRKNGLVVWTEAHTQTACHTWGEALAAALLGKVDALEMLADSFTATLPLAYRLWQVGCWLPVVGASGKVANTQAVGSCRTYAQVGTATPFTYQAWIEAVRAGRTYATTGPLLTLKVADKTPGETLFVAAGESVLVHAEAQSSQPFEVLELVQNGQVLLRAESSGQPVQRACIEQKLMINEPGWLALRCRRGAEVLAHTSALRVRLHQAGPVYDQASAQFLHADLERTHTWLEQAARCENPQRQAQLSEVVRQAQTVLLLRGERRGVS